ncbi:MAG TPA: prenyltransferase/squalene oxidase repeat-containing protein [Streptosporangiaceae bacterium]|jgi:hypothetical protein
MPLAPHSSVRTRTTSSAFAQFAWARVTAACLAVASLTVASLAAFAPPAAAAASPNLVTGSAYLVAPANLIDGHFYESYPGYADFGLTIDGALALAATGEQDSALKGIVQFLDDDGKDPHGYTVNTWTGIGTRYAAGGALADEALLAEATGYDPGKFSGHNLITALNASVCAHATTGSNTSCAGAGNYTYASSTFDQALGIIAQLRDSQKSQAAAPITFLEGLRNSDGSFPSLIPNSHDQDVDSTAAAAMALALVPGTGAAADVNSALAWIASRQESNGGFPGTSGDSVNSTGLAIQALTLQASHYRPQIDAALGFLAAEQNSNGGFNVAATGQRGSNVRASTQALGGAVGTSFGTLSRNLTSTPPPPPSSPTPTPAPSSTPASQPPSSPQPAPAVTVTITRTAAPAPAPSTSPPTPISFPTVHPALADSSHTSTVTTDLWYAVTVTAIAAALVITLLYIRRRRLYPHPPPGATP